MKSKKKTTRLRFGKTGWLIDFIDCDDVIAGVADVFCGWDIHNVRVTQRKARAVVARNRKGWSWKEQGAHKPRLWDSRPPKDHIRVINDILDVAIYWYLAEQQQKLCIHGAAAKFGRGLVCFPARYRAGKSTMMAALAKVGAKIFADDVLLVERGRGVSFGFLMRMRAPLPESLDEGFKQFIVERQVCINAKWKYLKPEPHLQAGHGNSSPISAFVLLERQEGAAAQLTPAREVDVLHSLITENILCSMPLVKAFDRLHRLCKSRPKFKLVYSNPDEASQLLMREFG